jgi:hypothetical protein
MPSGLLLADAVCPSEPFEASVMSPTIHCAGLVISLLHHCQPLAVTALSFWRIPEMELLLATKQLDSSFRRPRVGGELGANRKQSLGFLSPVFPSIFLTHPLVLLPHIYPSTDTLVLTVGWTSGLIDPAACGNQTDVPVSLT